MHLMALSVFGRLLISSTITPMAMAPPSSPHQEQLLGSFKTRLMSDRYIEELLDRNIIESGILCVCAGWYQRANTCAPADVLIHWIKSIVQGRCQLLWKTSNNSYSFSPLPPPLSLFLSLPLSLSLGKSMVNVFLLLFPQGIQFYTQMKTITSLWREEDAAGATPTVMPTMK